MNDGLVAWNMGTNEPGALSDLADRIRLRFANSNVQEFIRWREKMRREIAEAAEWHSPVGDPRENPPLCPCGSPKTYWEERSETMSHVRYYAHCEKCGAEIDIDREGWV